jgi:chromosomal replication initiation ATPase DnaA
MSIDRHDFLEVALAVIRERVMMQDEAVIDRLSLHHPEHYAGPRAASIKIVETAPVRRAVPKLQMPPEPVAQMTPPDTGRPKTLRKIVRAACKHFNITFADLIATGRVLQRVRQRQIIIYLCRTNTKFSYPQIGRVLGGRDHSTIIHAFERAEHRMQCDIDFMTDCEDLKAKLFKVAA